MIIGVDFDGTCCEHKYPKIGQPVPDATHWLKEFVKAGAKLVLWTCRCTDGPYGDTLTPAVEYLKKRGVELWGVNKNPLQDAWSLSPKAQCDVYIDDAAFNCPLIDGKFGDRKMVNWEIVGPAVMELLPG